MFACRTYTTPYMGDVHISAPPGDGNHVGLPDSNGHSAAGASCCPPDSPASVASSAAEQSPGFARDANSRPHAEAGARWQRSEQQIDRSALMTRDPILFYDDVTLHVSELDDNGVSQLTVKARTAVALHWLALSFAGACRWRLCPIVRTFVSTWPAASLAQLVVCTVGSAYSCRRTILYPPCDLTSILCLGMTGWSTMVRNSLLMLFIMQRPLCCVAQLRVATNLINRPTGSINLTAKIIVPRRLPCRCG